ncbi:alpha/beta fold hydrolase [Novosphingobium sp. TH158]|uniref:alpha/beta fold hydrolase n=1 Tax=Novosphingobium sp. TH158 TaxID=2067455 RepID=UPI000C7E23BE|nr:alpha/beta fold hydrolase [Novosphingobium sp. TH158]PLK24284.1 3-oxoadipate enol-lactonase [Novosphingobium sp. TH158]
MLLKAPSHTICFDSVGDDALPVVCLLHTLSSDMGIWADQVGPLLGAGYRVLRVDMRGHGGSGATAGSYDMGELAADVVTVLDHLGIGKVHLGGVSIGGMIGQQFALDHPHRLHSLLLSGTSARSVPAGKDIWDARFAAIASAASVGAIADDTMERWFTAGFRTRRPERWRQVHGTVSACPVAGYVSGAHAIFAFDVVDRLPRISAPTLVICGDDDPGTPAEGNRLIADRIAGARYHEIAEARHIPMAEHPELYSRLMLDWLAANPAR